MYACRVRGFVKLSGITVQSRGVPVSGRLLDACRAHEEWAVQLRVAVQPNVPLPSEGAPEFVRVLRERRELPSRECFFQKVDDLTADTLAPPSLPSR